MGKCSICQKDIWVKPSREHLEHHYCSRVCMGIGFTRFFSAKHSHMFGTNGAAHPSWRGGSPTYYGPNWNQQRDKVRHRASYQCQSCGRTETELGRQLHIDHVRPFTGFASYKEANRLSNLRALCPYCHNHLEHQKHPTPRFLNFVVNGIRPCAWCGHLFVPRRYSTKYCSWQCVGYGTSRSRVAVKTP